MSRADKKKIEELQQEVRGLSDRACRWQAAFVESERTVKNLEAELQQEKERYARLLERHIETMEKVVRSDG